MHEMKSHQTFIRPLPKVSVVQQVLLSDTMDGSSRCFLERDIVSL